MKTLVAFAAAVAISGWSVALACGSDGKCVGKEKASCCMSKSSAKKSCSVKQSASEAKLDAKTEQAPAAAEAAKSDAPTTNQPAATPKR
ncbi:MAG: hypothetical protein KatS3mg039_1361 [Candidatus Kapaibacterium sp.]|nr:MAG: hypothetical protein KatS3mg039_1361 [Candidatus Kapabacteria bacterium]